MLLGEKWIQASDSLILLGHSIFSISAKIWTDFQGISMNAFSRKVMLVSDSLIPDISIFGCFYFWKLPRTFIFLFLEIVVCGWFFTAVFWFHSKFTFSVYIVFVCYSIQSIWHFPFFALGDFFFLQMGLLSNGWNYFWSFKHCFNLFVKDVVLIAHLF